MLYPFVFLLQFLITLPVFIACTQQSPKKEVHFQQDYVFLYWLPYDNDLSKMANQVIQDIRKGTQKGLVAAIQADTADSSFMIRHTFEEGTGSFEILIQKTDSADIENFKEFLDWASHKYEAHSYVITLLNHGGGLNQICRDDQPNSTKKIPNWLHIEDVSQAIKNFREQEPGEVELVFLQVCDKATLEAFWSFRDAAKYTLASQFLLAAPNTYYTPALKKISKNPKWSGAKIAEVIANADAPEMYVGLTCIDNSELKNLPQKLSPFLTNERPYLTQEVADSTWVYAGDGYIDLGAFLSTYKNSKYAKTLKKWVDEKVICGKYHSQNPPSSILIDVPAQPPSGISLYLPPQGKIPTPYKKLSIYKETSLAKWVESLSQNATTIKNSTP